MDVSSVLFLGNGNTSRSPIAEAILKHMYSQRFSALSAGVGWDENKFKETAGINPLALEVLRLHNYPVEGLHSKSMEILIASGSKPDVILTLSDESRDVALQYQEKFSGNPVIAHWGVVDLENLSGDKDELRQAFQEGFAILRRRIERLASLPIEILGREALRRNLEKIGQ